jgi:hypothetical protein
MLLTLLFLNEDWQTLHSEELPNFCSSPHIIRMIKSRTMRWAGHVARIGICEICTKLQSKTLKGRDHSDELSVEGEMIIERILRE